MMPAWMRSMRNGRSMSLQQTRVKSVPLFLILVTVFLIGYLHFSRPDDPTILGAVRTNSEFLVNSNAFIGTPMDLTFTDKPKLPSSTVFKVLPEPLKPKTPKMRVPNSVHLVFGLREPSEGDSGPDYPYWAYLAYRSIILNLRPEKIYFYYHYKPQGPYWDAIEPHLTLIKVDVPTEIFGNPVGNYAHAADVIRLYAIQHSGGIYLDIDMFIIRSFDEFLTYPTTMGMEQQWYPTLPMDPAGLCNGVIIAEPNAPFINRWLDQYQNFNTSEWAFHSVHLPWHIARHHPEEIQVLNSDAMFAPLWTEGEVRRIHELDDYNFKATKQYAYHAWESQSRKFMDKLTPNEIRARDTSFRKLVYDFMGPDDDELHDEWVRWQTAHGRKP